MKLIELYCNPCWVSRYPYFDEEKENLLKSIIEFREKNDGDFCPHALSSFENLFHYIGGFVKKSCEDLEFKQGNVYITSSWVNYADDKTFYKEVHTHDRIFSGVFYLKAPKNSGQLVFHDLQKRSGTSDFSNFSKLVNKKNISISPVEGEMFVWPSYLPHSVTPNNHDDERISISFVATYIPKESEFYEEIEDDEDTEKKYLSE